MKAEMIFSGIGGQGTILMGKMICTAAAKKGYQVTLAPAYGQEKRGGRASCQVVISKEIGSPVISMADTVLVMDEKSLDDYEQKVKTNGYLILNASMIHKKVARTDIHVLAIPFTAIASDIGTVKSANMVALGAVIQSIKGITVDDVAAVIQSQMDSQIADINIKALKAGFNYGDLGDGGSLVSK